MKLVSVSEGVVTGTFSGPQIFPTLEAPDEVEAGWRHIAGAWHPPSPTPAELLALARTEMAALFDAMTIPQQAAFYRTRVAVETALDRGHAAVAREIIAQVAVPAELEETKAQILAHFPE